MSKSVTLQDILDELSSCDKLICLRQEGQPLRTPSELEEYLIEQGAREDLTDFNFTVVEGKQSGTRYIQDDEGTAWYVITTPFKG